MNFYFQVTKLNIKCLNEVDCVQHYPTSTVTDLLMNSEQLPEIRRRNSAKNGRTDHSGTNQILPAAAASSLESQSPQTSEGKKMRMLQVNLFQKHLFLHQITHNMTKDCSFIYQISI